MYVPKAVLDSEINYGYSWKLACSYHRRCLLCLRTTPHEKGFCLESKQRIYSWLLLVSAGRWNPVTHPTILQYLDPYTTPVWHPRILQYMEQSGRAGREVLRLPLRLSSWYRQSLFLIRCCHSAPLHNSTNNFLDIGQWGNLRYRKKDIVRYLKFQVSRDSALNRSDGHHCIAHYKTDLQRLPERYRAIIYLIIIVSSSSSSCSAIRRT